MDILPTKNYFYCGNYKAASEFTGNDKIAKFFILRSNLALNAFKQSPDSDVEFKALNLLASNSYSKDKTLAFIPCLSPLVAVIISTIYINLSLFNDALVLLSKFPKDLECCAFTIQIYLFFNRFDLADRQVAAMRSWADDSTLAQLVEAWVDTTSSDKKKLKDAFYIYEELFRRNKSALLANGMAVCKIVQGKFSDAETILVDSVANGDSYANLVLISHSLGKDADAHIKNLEALDPKHKFLVEREARSALFDKCAKKYTF